MSTTVTHDKNQKNETITIGIRLRNARKQLGLSQQVVAERLCLKVSTIRDIEEDRVPTDLAVTFLRGYIRSYARLVYIPEDELLPMIEKQKELDQKKKVASIRSLSSKINHKKRDGLVTIFTWLLLFTMIAFTGIWWWQSYKVQQEEITFMTNSSPNLKSIEEID